jgi:hypothetical protein
VRPLGQAVVRVFHRRVLRVEGQPHGGVKEGERDVGLILVEGGFEKGLPHAHPELPVGRALGKQPLQFSPRPVHRVAIKLDAAPGIQGSLRPRPVFECLFRLGGQGVELRQIAAMGSQNQSGGAPRMGLRFKRKRCQRRRRAWREQPPPRRAAGRGCLG